MSFFSPKIRFHRNRYLLATCSVVALSASFSSAMAQSGSSSQPTVLPPITVSATGIATPTDQIASSVTVITADDIERTQRRTVTDLLATVPGLNVVQTGAPGTFTSVFIRGTESRHVKVLIDGVEVVDAGNPTRAFDFGNLTTFDIERIEVLRGPQSGFYGADAIGGVISITTKKGKGPAKATATVEGGSFNTFNQAVGVSGSSPFKNGSEFNYAVNVSHVHSGSTRVTPDRYVAPGTNAAANTYDNKTYSTRLGYDLNEYLSANLITRYSDADLGFVSGFGPFVDTSLSRGITRTLTNRAEVVAKLLDGRFVNTFGTNYTDWYRWSKSPTGAPSTFNSYRNAYDWRGDFTIAPGQVLVAGLQSDLDRSKSPTTGFHSNGNKAGFVELQSNFRETFFLVANVRRDNNDAFGGANTYRIAPAVIVPWTQTKLKVSYGTGFKVPSLSQLYDDFRPGFNFFGNPNLNPERSTGWDAGFEQPVWNDRIRFGATYFGNDIKDLIQSTATSYTNVAKARTWGWELFAEAKVMPTLSFRGDYTYTKAIDATTNLDLIRRPQDKYSLTSIWQPDARWTLTTTLLRVGGWIDVDRFTGAGRAPVSGYTTVNLAANYMVNDYVTLFARGDNLFNRTYENPFGYQQPGLGVFGGIKVATSK